MRNVTAILGGFCLLLLSASTVFARPIVNAADAPIVAAGDGATPTADNVSERDGRANEGESGSPAVADLGPALPGLALADFTGAPILLVSPPQFLFLDPRGKLRGGSPFGDSSSTGGAGMSNVGFQAGGAPEPGTYNPNAAVGAAVAVPEPATILLFAPALAWGLRRRRNRAAR